MTDRVERDVNLAKFVDEAEKGIDETFKKILDRKSILLTLLKKKSA